MSGEAKPTMGEATPVHIIPIDAIMVKPTSTSTGPSTTTPSNISEDQQKPATTSQKVFALMVFVFGTVGGLIVPKILSLLAQQVAIYLQPFAQEVAWEVCRKTPFSAAVLGAVFVLRLMPILVLLYLMNAECFRDINNFMKVVTLC